MLGERNEQRFDVMKCSVVIPCYNQSKYLSKCVYSVRQQDTDFEIEVIVVDDGSDVPVDGYCRGFDKLLRQENKGLSSARNYGVKESTGDVVVCLDADDIIPQNYIQELGEVLDDGYVDIVYANSQQFGLEYKYLRYPEFNGVEFRKGNYVNCSAMYCRGVWEDIGGYDVDMRSGSEDYDFWLRALRCGKIFKKCNTTHLLCRQHGDNMSKKEQKSFDKVKKFLHNKHKAWYLG